MIISICGYQDSGKTTLVEKLVQALVRKGYKVSSVKHAPCRKGVDSKGKDTWRHWQAGSDPVVFSSDIETTVIKHSKTPIEEIVRLVMADYHPDVVIVEGHKRGPFKKVTVGDLGPTEGVVLSNPSLKTLVDYVETEVAVERILRMLPGLDCEKCGHDCEGLARAVVGRRHRIEDCIELSNVNIEIFIGENKIPTGKFASKVVHDTVRGLLSSLHGYESDKDVVINIRAKKPIQRDKKR